MRVKFCNFHIVFFSYIPTCLQTFDVTPHSTMWKFQDFPITQILLEINLGVSRSEKFAFITHLEALNFDLYEILHFLKTEIYQIIEIHRLKNGKNASFRTSSVCKIDFT